MSWTIILIKGKNKRADTDYDHEIKKTSSFLSSICSSARNFYQLKLLAAKYFFEAAALIVFDAARILQTFINQQ